MAQKKFFTLNLHIEVAFGNIEACKLLIAAGANVNGHDTEGNTPLMFATDISKYVVPVFPDLCPTWMLPSEYKREPSVDIVKLLLNAGAISNANNRKGNTPLMFASETGNLEICKLLLESGANVNAKNNGGNTPLMFAANSGNLEICKLLLKSGANINAQDKGGNTPLHYAAFFGSFDICKLLVESGAVLSVFNKYLRTPVCLARELVELVSDEQTRAMLTYLDAALEATLIP